ncbi:MAG: hypothetical protein PVG91_05185 [Gammaproteobacteria bacterium]|jgi:hypothetical protein
MDERPRSPDHGLRTALAALLAGIIMLIPATQAMADKDRPARLLYVVTEPGKISASNILFSRTDEFELSAREEILEQRTDNAVAAFLTNKRLLGYSVYTASWVPLPLKAGETVEQFEAEDYSAFALTSRRILNFNGRIGYWSVTRR